jgi:hypothetical protein
MRRILLAVPAAVIVAAFVMIGPAASAATTCSGGVFTGVNVSGGLVVTGRCIYHDSTISGGVTVTSTGGFEIENSSVSGGITVQPGGELDVDHVLSGFASTGNHSSISGGIKFTNGVDLDIYGATITGGTTISGPISGGVPFICGSTLDSLTESNVTGTFTHALIGDPGEAVQGGPVPDCPGNTFTSSVTVTNSHNLEMESNVVGGSVTISDSTAVELAGNTIKGSAHCTNITTATDGDATPNTVQGSNNCP